MAADRFKYPNLLATSLSRCASWLPLNVDRACHKAAVPTRDSYQPSGPPY